MPASRSSDTVLLSLDASFSLSLTVCMRIEHALLGLHHQTSKHSMHTCTFGPQAHADQPATPGPAPPAALALPAPFLQVAAAATCLLPRNPVRRLLAGKFAHSCECGSDVVLMARPMQRTAPASHWGSRSSGTSLQLGRSQDGA